MNADNAVSNDTQSSELAQLKNSFKEEQCIQCFNHTMQLSVKALLWPFNTGLDKTTDETVTNGDDNMPGLEELDKDDKDEEWDDEPSEDAEDGVVIILGTTQDIR